MKRSLLLASAAFGLAAFNVSAQIPAGLEVQTYAGLTVTGTVGTVYSIEYVSDLAQTNTPSAWRCLEFLQLPTSPFLWADKSAPATAKRFYRAVEFAAPTNMVFIPPGTFRMGSPTNEVDRDEWEGPQTAVIISRGFWMGKFEATQGEYVSLMNTNPSWFNGLRTTGWPTGDFGSDLRRPVETVSWEDAVAYCAALTHQERNAGRIPPNCVYRLPTEAEWEYSCRAWTSTRFSYGDDPGYMNRETFETVGYTNLTNYAWYAGNYSGTTHPVGQKLPNAWGLYDMHGNVLEWCQDWWEYYRGGTVVDRQGPATGSYPVMRGGGWNFYARYCRVAIRTIYLQGVLIGFRVVLAPGQP